jgi:hypothetical protein
MKALRSFKFAIAILVEMVVVVALAGCSMPKASDFKPSKLFSLGDDDEPQKGIPVRMVGTWTDTVLTKAGQKPQRGFGGRLMFYANNEEKPILVDGQLVVYAFDETGRAVTDNKPTRRYVFPPDQMPLHMSKSELGASYSFWLPWDEAGGPQTEVSLVCRFEPKGGGVITSEQTRHLLPGSLPAADKVADGKPPKLPEGVPSRPAQPTLESVQQGRTVDHNLRLASFESMTPSVDPVDTSTGPAANEPDQQMKITSIALPAHYQLPVASPAQQPVATTARNSAQTLPLMSGQQPMSALQPTQPATMTTPPAASAIPAQPTPSPMQPGFGVFPSQSPFGQLRQMPAMRPPTTGGFGTAAPSPPQLATQPQAPQLARGPHSRTTTWNTVQQMSPGIHQQPQTSAAGISPPSAMPAVFTPMPQQVVMQPASQPLPPASGVTTSVSYSPAQ